MLWLLKNQFVKDNNLRHKLKLLGLLWNIIILLLLKQLLLNKLLLLRQHRNRLLHKLYKQHKDPYCFRQIMCKHLHLMLQQRHDQKLGYQLLHKHKLMFQCYMLLRRKHKAQMVNMLLYQLLLRHMRMHQFLNKLHMLQK